MNEVMELYNVPRNSFVEAVRDIKVPPIAPNISSGEVLFFHHLDGMYSLCNKRNGEICHLASWAKVIIVDKPENWRSYNGQIASTNTA